MAAVHALDESRFGYLKQADVASLADAYRFSEAAHKGQKRQSGDPYVSHPLAVAEILADWHLDGQALVAALLHDVMEDTSVTKDELSDTFGKPVADLVDGVSKLDKIEFQSAEDAQAENFRKMLLAMARDVRVILIKLADRLHNVQGTKVTVKARLAALKDIKVWKYSQYYSIVFGGYVALALWMTKYYVSEYGFDIKDAALLAAAFSLPGGVLRAIGGVLSDKYGAHTVTWWVLWVHWSASSSSPIHRLNSPFIPSRDPRHSTLASAPPPSPS